MGNKYKKFRHEDITEVEESDMAPPLPKDRKGERKRKIANEFWSDPCWSESERPSD
jgi:hypothetical protein